MGLWVKGFQAFFSEGTFNIHNTFLVSLFSTACGDLYGFCVRGVGLKPQASAKSCILSSKPSNHKLPSACAIGSTDSIP